MDIGLPFLKNMQYAPAINPIPIEDKATTAKANKTRPIFVKLIFRSKKK